MNCLRWNKGSMLVFVYGMILLGACVAQAQEAKRSGQVKNLNEAAPSQAQEPFSVRLNLDDQHEDVNVSVLKDWNMRIARFRDTADDMLGAPQLPVGDSLRTQLVIPDRQGLVVEG